MTCIAAHGPSGVWRDNPITGERERRCSRCHRYKPASSQWFRRHKGTAGGLSPRCKACASWFPAFTPAPLSPPPPPCTNPPHHWLIQDPDKSGRQVGACAKCQAQHVWFVPSEEEMDQRLTERMTSWARKRRTLTPRYPTEPVEQVNDIWW